MMSVTDVPLGNSKHNRRGKEGRREGGKEGEKEGRRERGKEGLEAR